jgi:hypothetical protein
MKLTVALLCAAATLSAGCGGDETNATTSNTSAPTPEVVSKRSAPFAKYSGRGPAKLRLAEFGIEASKDDRLEAQATINAFLVASRKGQWERACGYTSEVLRAQIAELIRRYKGSPKPSCGEVLKALASRPGEKTAPLSAPDGVSSFRIKESPGGGFALFHGSDGKDHWMAVRRDGGRWKVLSVAPQLFE